MFSPRDRGGLRVILFGIAAAWIGEDALRLRDPGEQCHECFI